MAKPPVKTLKFGKMELSVWEGEYKGKTTTSYSIQKSYKDKQDEWKQTTFFYLVDLRDLLILLIGFVTGGIKERIPDTGSQEKSAVEQPEANTRQMDDDGYYQQ